MVENGYKVNNKRDTNGCARCCCVLLTLAFVILALAAVGLVYQDEIREVLKKSSESSFAI